MQKPPLKFLDRSAAPARLDRYELIAEIATGGMGTVYLARIAGAGGFSRFVAIKRLHSHLAEEQEFVAMFLDEARLAAGIHHPNVVPILDVGESKAGYYLVLDYVEGESLGGLRRDASARGYDFAPSVLARIAVDSLLGLHAAHELRDEHNRPLHIVHRDVSPQNILVGVDGMSRLIDFGIARAARRLSSTRTGEVKGKLAYMAPEQVKRGVVDRRTDVFAAGIVFWEMLTARRLFRGDSDLETLNRVVVGEIPDVREVNRAVPAGLANAVARALVRESDGRFPTAQAFADAIVETTAVASVQEVASYTEFLIGEDIRQRRDSVRKWLQPKPGSLDDDDEPELGTQTLMVHKTKRPDEWARSGSSLPSVAEASDLEDQTLTQQMVRGGKKDRPAPQAPRIVGLPGSPAPSPYREVLEVKTRADLVSPLKVPPRPQAQPAPAGPASFGPPRPQPSALAAMPPPPASVTPPPPPAPPPAAPAPPAPPAVMQPGPTASYQPAPPASTLPGGFSVGPPAYAQPPPPSSSLPGGFTHSPSYPPPPPSSAVPNRIPGPLPSPHFDSLSIVPTSGLGPHGAGVGAQLPLSQDALGARPQPGMGMSGQSFSNLSPADAAALAGRSRTPIGLIVAGVIGIIAFVGFLALVGGWLATDPAPTPPPGTIAPKR